MTVERRAGAPRLIDWTGERCVPWAPDVQVVYEHYHRYLWAARLVEGRRVLDLGSGEGFGAAILAGRARTVLGIDIDQTTVEHARLNYSASNLSFEVGSAVDLDGLEDGAFDAVVAFEIIEHVEAQEQVLDGVKRVLARDGLLILSTPDRLVYNAGVERENPFHERELTEVEFRELLTTRFGHVNIWGQRAMSGSRLTTLDGVEDGHTVSVAIERAGDEWRESGEPAPVYLVALASQAELAPAGAQSYLSDCGLEIVRAQERVAAHERASAERARSESEILVPTLKTQQREIEDLRRRLRSEADQYLGQIAERERDVRAGVEAVARMEGDVAEDRARLRKIDGSVTWKLFERVRGRLYGALGGRETLPARALQWSLRTAGRGIAAGPAKHAVSGPAPIRPIRFPLVENPVASIVIPVHAHPELTEACLRSIAENTDGPAYEVLVVDDQASGHEAVWDALENAQVIHNESVQGYLRNNNFAAEQSRGEFLVLLNNDTEVQPGWLKALVGRAESDADIGVVVPKLLFPNGSLQEAGGIIFSDGTGWNYGRGLDPERPEFNYVREVDYGSGACLLVRAELWRELGGLDERYRPMYYEDTDLCFAARERGAKVVYEFSARVVHVEGATAGTDVADGFKRYQELNRPKFADKWRGRLEAEQLRASPANARRASDRNRGPHVLVIDHRLPTPDRDSGSLRMMAMLQGLMNLGCRVTFLPDNHLRAEPYTQWLQGLGVEVLYDPINVPAEIASIGPYLRMAIVSRPYVAARYLHLVREYSPAARIVYDTVDLHYVRERRRAELEGDGVAVVAETWREIELALVRSADVTAVVSEDERTEIEQQVSGADVVVLPNANVVREQVPDANGREGLLFVGGFEHLPNVDAAVWLVRTIMPHVWKELGDVSVSIAGADPPPEVQALNGPGVEVLGWVEDLQPLLDESRVMVAPLRYGAGMKGKVTQSLANGLPVVTTAIGAEGLDATDRQELLIADEPGAIAERIVDAYRDDALWRTLSERGRVLVNRTCSPDVLHGQLAALLETSDSSQTVV